MDTATLMTIGTSALVFGAGLFGIGLVTADRSDALSERAMQAGVILGAFAIVVFVYEAAFVTGGGDGGSGCGGGGFQNTTSFDDC